MLFLLFLTAQAALPTDWANVYYCAAETDCLDYRENFGWAGPQASFVMCRDTNLIESDLQTWNYVMDGKKPSGSGMGRPAGSGGRGEIIELEPFDYFAGADTWDVAAAILNGTAPATVDFSGRTYHVAQQCCPGNKNEQCIMPRCEAARNKKQCSAMKGCIYNKRKCRELKPAGICNDYKTKKACRNSSKVTKTLQEPPSDGVKGKGCMWYGKGKDAQCRPYLDLNCKNIKNMSKCAAMDGCRVKGRNPKKQRCAGKRKPMSEYPNYGSGACEIDEECTCFGGTCDSMWGPEPTPEFGAPKDPDAPPLDFIMPQKSCMCMMIGRPYTGKKSWKSSKAASNDDWCEA